jgi:serine/threonine protein kinase
MIGTTVGKYRILDRLGRGGMGIVYKALDETLDREVAIKVLNPELGEANVLKRFRAEAMSLARLNHPGIATIYELHKHEDDELLMVMEFVRGETLQALSERLGPLDPPQAAHICIQILEALSHAHRAGVVHRDLKPANVMVTDTGIVKVMDFGIARMMGTEQVTNAGFMMGTPAYMAPEQVLGQELDGRADLYAVGVLFYRLLSRELPFQADTAIAMAQKQVADAPTPIATFRPDLPAWCELVITKALCKAPADRFQTAEAFRAAIVSAVTPVTLGELPTMATPTAGLRQSDLTLPSAARSLATAPGMTATHSVSGAVTSASARSATVVTAPIERTATTVVLGRSHVILFTAFLVILVAGIAALAFAVLKRGNDGAPQTAVTSAPVDPAAASGTAGTQPVSPPIPAPDATVSKPPADAAVPAPAPGTAASKPELPAAPKAATTPPATPRVPAAAPPSTKPSAPGPVAPTDTNTVAKAPAPGSLGPLPSKSPVKAALPPVTFNGIKVAVAQGKTLREREVVLTLNGDRMSVVDRSGTAQILSLTYASIVQAFFSRSKQPTWRGPDGKTVEASVDLGKMGFFRGDRNWLILLTKGEPVFLRFEDGDRRAVLAAIEQRSGVSIQNVK